MPTAVTLSRAFTALAFSLFAACVGSSRAAAPAQPHAYAPGPEDPYAGEGGEGDGNEAAFQGQSCPPNASCSFDCDDGGCAFFCAEGSTCAVQCDGGNCQLSCAGDATCNLECDGGNCGTGCGDGATCNVECDGGNCASACAPEASCNTECDGGNCS
ncbi:MAG: hypothetical protein H7138_16740 [Myxococcales bacterium]|nr:hypothetical protein [Myxococcales bacterium]